MHYYILFFTHSGAIKFERKCKADNIVCELMPVPRVLSSNCSISAKIEYEEDINKLVNDDIEKIFKIENDNNILVFEND